MYYKARCHKGLIKHDVSYVLWVCPREDQVGVTHAISPTSHKLSEMIQVIKLFMSQMHDVSYVL